MRRSLTIAIAVAVVAGAAGGGYALGRHHGLSVGVRIGQGQAERSAERASRPVVMPLLMPTDEPTEALLAALGWPTERLGDVDPALWTTLLNQVPSPDPATRREGQTLAHDIDSADGCEVCGPQAAFGLDLLAAGHGLEAARQRLYEGQRVELDLDGAIRLGPDDAPVTIVWWTDFQCPYCAECFPVIAALHERYADQVQIAIMHLPLRMHPQADEAALAAQAAAAQGRFLDLAPVLFDRRRKLKRYVPDGDGVAMEKLARKAGLDLDRYAADYLAARDGGVLERHRELARGVGVRSVPTFYINGHKVRIARTEAAFADYVDRILAGDDPALE